MGPDDYHLEFLVDSRFTRDIKTLPLPDGVGDPTPYAQSIRHWCAFFNSVADTKSNKICPKNRGVVFLPHLFENGASVCRIKHQDLIYTKDVTAFLIHTVHKTSALSVVLDVYAQIQQLFRTTRSSNKNFRLFEGRLDARLHRLNVLCSTNALSDSVRPLFLLNNSNVDNDQRMSIFAAYSLSKGGLFTPSLPSEFISLVRHEAVASVLCLCDDLTPQHQHALTSVTASAQAMAVYQSRHRHARFQGGPQRCRDNLCPGALNNEQTRAEKSMSAYVRCGQYGHW